MQSLSGTLGKVLVTGSAGMLGSAVVRALRPGGQFDVVGWRREDGDLRNFSDTIQRLSALRPDYVVHCAAKVGGIQANIDAPVDFLLQNLEIDASIIHASLELGIRNFVYVGSSCMYPKDFRQPLLEEDLLAAPLELTNEGYALSKIVGSKLSGYIAKQYGLNYKTIIPSNLYGAGDRLDGVGSHLVAACLRKAIDAKEKKENQLLVWGDGKARREFTHVDDVSNWIANQLFSIQNWPETLNLGLGVDFSVEDFHNFALRVVGHEAGLVFQPEKPVGMRQKLLDSSVARTRFGWEPSILPEAGMLMTLQSLGEVTNG
jgi:GDP-L-fucose synthase